MEKVKSLLEETIDQQFRQMIISNPRRKGGNTKVKIRPVLIKGTMFYQEEQYRDHQVFHNNIPWAQKKILINRIIEYMQEFKQLEWKTQQEQFTVLVNRRQQASIKRRQQTETQSEGMEYAHNRKKKYILQEGSPIDFLVELGVMSKEGNVIKTRYDKFRQINRFLEFIDDVEEHFPKNHQLTIIDFGCGKSYLTFAIYYYLHILKKYDVRIIGLDLKQEVIRNCTKLAQKLGYEHLEFLHGDIAEYEGVVKADLVVTLHACDTATDYALAKAVKWNAGVILSVPCCQHELNRQMYAEVLEPMFRYGLIKERAAALFTDALRAELLEQQGYQVQILEFIDMEHTPKNILLRAVQKKSRQSQIPAKMQRQENGIERYRKCRDFLGADPTLEKLLR
ncbi:MAG: SAM-dependent methyltransferase [Lachnospiraceae bacterium]|nr:SAM-dependent methyltransferase [Lachnospiraceae bacterium]